jgi:hypothetical protein
LSQREERRKARVRALLQPTVFLPDNKPPEPEQT